MEAAADCNTNLDSLFEDLMHPNPRIQEDACREMAEKYASEALPRLLDLFEHEDPKVYRGAVKGVGFFGYEAFSQSLIFMVKPKSNRKRCCPNICSVVQKFS